MLLDLVRGADVGFVDIVIYVISCLAIIFITLPIHELAHGFVAYKLGDPTAKYQGRLTLNPLAHVDYMGAFCILLFGFGWAKAVPVNMGYFKNPKRDMAITALAGPVSNLLMALVCYLILCVFYFVVGINNIVLAYVVSFFDYIATISISLAVFNLIPIPPLDGSRILTAVLPSKYYYSLMRYERYFFLIILLLLATNILTVPLGFLSSNLKSALWWLASLPFRLFV